MLDEKYFFPPPYWGSPSPSSRSPEKPAYTMTEEMERTMHEMRDTLGRLLRLEEHLKTEYERMSKTFASDVARFKETFAESHEAFIKTVKDEIIRIEGNYSTLSNDIRAAVNENYLNYVDKLNDYRTSMNKTYDEFRAFLENKLHELEME